MNRAALSNQLVLDEGLRLKPYTDTVGKTTLGVGRNLTDRGITQIEAMMLLDNDIITVEKDLDRSLPWWRSLSEARQQAVSNMVFNLGIIRFLGFKKMLAALQICDYVTASNEMLSSKWAEQVGKRANRLSDMILKG